MLKRTAAAFFVCVLMISASVSLTVAAAFDASRTPSPDVQRGRQPQTAAEWVAEGNRLYNLTLYDLAAKAYTNAVRLNPKDAGAQLRLAVSYNEMGLFAEALAAADAAITLNPGSAEAHNERAYAQEGLGDEQPQGSPAEKQRYDAAIASYREAIRLKPAFGLAYQGLGDIYFMVGASTDAITAYTEAVRLIPSNARRRYNLGVVLSIQNRDKEAAEQLAEAVRLDPDDYDARGALATEYRRLGLLVESLEQLRLALRTKPDYAGGHVRLALVYAAQGNRAAALDEYRIAEALDKSVLEGVAAMLAKSGVIVQPLAGAPKPPPRGVCPTVQVSGATEVRSGQSTTFTAAVTGGDPDATVTYNWNVSAGTISSGQGTSSITVDTTAVSGPSTTAFVAVGGLEKQCNQRSAARTTLLGRHLPY